jgi:hypothetical protein
LPTRRIEFSVFSRDLSNGSLFSAVLRRSEPSWSLGRKPLTAISVASDAFVIPISSDYWRLPTGEGDVGSPFQSDHAQQAHPEEIWHRQAPALAFFADGTMISMCLSFGGGCP